MLQPPRKSFAACERTKRLIYVVDDQQELLNLVLLIIQTRPEWDGKGFADPNDALAAVKAAPPDLIISDQCMPQMAGSDMLRRVRETSPRTARVIMSGEILPEQLREIDVAHHYIAKPFSVAQLKRLIAVACEERDEWLPENRETG